jgi:hypothetical protein
MAALYWGSGNRGATCGWHFDTSQRIPKYRIADPVVALFEFQRDPSRIAHRQAIGGDILGYHAACTDYAIAADGTTGKNDQARALRATSQPL